MYIQIIKLINNINKLKLRVMFTRNEKMKLKLVILYVITAVCLLFIMKLK